MKLEPGNIVWLVKKNYRGKAIEPLESTVETVGRKYFTIDSDKRTKYSLETGYEANESNYKSKVYLTLQEIIEERELHRLRREITKAFDWMNIRKYSLDQLRKVSIIVGQNEIESNG